MVMEGKFKMQAFSNLTLVGRNSRAKSIDCYNSKLLWKAHIETQTRWIFGFRQNIGLLGRKTRKRTILQNMGLEQERLGKRRCRCPFCFPLRWACPRQIPSAVGQGTLCYFEAQITHNLPTHETTLKDGIITVKNDLSERTKDVWRLFSVAGILLEFRYVGSFIVHGRERTVNGRMHFRFTHWKKSMSTMLRTSLYVSRLGQALDLVRGHYTGQISISADHRR